MSSLKIGVLVPVSRMFPRLDQDFLAGLRGALAERGTEHELAIEPAGNAADAAAVTGTVQRLLLQHRPHVVTGVIGSAMLRVVHGFFSDAGVPFIVNNLGVEPLLNGGTRNPYVFHNSYNLWQSTYALGWWAARTLGTRAGIATGFHEAGYGIVAAFWNGFVEAGGGTVTATEITHKESSDEDPSAALRRIAASEPDFVMGLYAGRSALSFVQAYDALGFAESTPLISSAFLPHRQWLGDMGDAALGIRTAFSWNQSQRGDEHRVFRNACASVGWHDPDAFALLGYETGLALAGASERLAEAAYGGGSLREAIPDAPIDSPRGRHRFDAISGEMATSDYLLEVRRDGNGGAGLEAIDSLQLPERYPVDYAAFKGQEMRSGWTNAYMVT